MRKTVVILALLLASGSSTQAAETYYVDDELTITMRSGESTQHQIIRSLKSGTKLEVTETHEDTGYSFARTESGTEGWVLTRYLSSSPAAKQQLELANARVKKLETELADLRSNLKQISGERNLFDKTNSKLEKDNARLEKELQQIKETASNAIALDKDNKLLREKLIHRETELQTVEQQNSVLQDRSARDWFITGTGVTILGILVGLLVPKIRLQRKPKWNEI